MKLTYLFLGAMFFIGQLSAQKSPVVTTSNLNLSKSNINRLVYPANTLTAANAQALLAELENGNLTDQAKQKSWLCSNFRKFGVSPDVIKQIFIFAARQFEDCTICKKNCKGRCIQDPGTDCVCVQHSEPNLRISKDKASPAIILLSSAMMDEAAAIGLVAKKMEEKAQMSK